MHSKGEPHLFINLQIAFTSTDYLRGAYTAIHSHMNSFLRSLFYFSLEAALLWGHKGNVQKCWQNHISVPILEFG